MTKPRVIPYHYKASLAAKMIGIGPRYIIAMASDGRIRAQRHGLMWYFHEDDIWQYKRDMMDSGDLSRNSRQLAKLLNISIDDLGEVLGHSDTFWYGLANGTTMRTRTYREYRMIHGYDMIYKIIDLYLRPFMYGRKYEIEIRHDGRLSRHIAVYFGDNCVVSATCEHIANELTTILPKLVSDILKTGKPIQ